MKSAAKTVEEYLAEQPEDRREALTKLRKDILKNLPEGYEEAMSWGVIAYQVPLSIYPDTYNKKPLMYAGLASQKNYMALYMMNVYNHPEKEAKLKEAFAKAGKKLDKGKGCIRFKTLDALELPILMELIASTPLKDYVNYAKSVRPAKK